MPDQEISFRRQKVESSQPERLESFLQEDFVPRNVTMFAESVELIDGTVSPIEEAQLVDLMGARIVGPGVLRLRRRSASRRSCRGRPCLESRLPASPAASVRGTIVVVTKAVYSYSVRARYFGLPLPSFWETKIIESEVPGPVRLAVPWKEWPRPADVAPIPRPPPPPFVLQCRMERWQVNCSVSDGRPSSLDISDTSEVAHQQGDQTATDWLREVEVL